MKELQDRYNPIIARKNVYQPAIRRVYRHDGECIFSLVYRGMKDISRWEEVCLLNGVEDPTDIPWEVLLPYE